MRRKVLTVVGARPQFIKAAVVSHELARHEDVIDIIVHTGQHYDRNMSQAFFDELSIPHPKVNLGISGGSHAEMTAGMMIALEETMLQEQPDIVLLYGDTNSTLAGALSAAKLHIPIAHVESGARTRSMTNPEEINRICTDHISTSLLACTPGNLENLQKEGLGARAQLVGDPMLDAFVAYSGQAKQPVLMSALDGAQLSLPEDFYYLTCHREENTSNSVSLRGILGAVQALDAPVVYPVHPRARKLACSLMDEESIDNLLLVDPVSYLESIYLVSHAKQVITDSGGLQREAFFADVKCTTLLDFVCWPETMIDNRNLLAKPEAASILAAMQQPQTIDSSYRPFGDGNASAKIVQAVIQQITGD